VATINISCINVLLYQLLTVCQEKNAGEMNKVKVEVNWLSWLE